MKRLFSKLTSFKFNHKECVLVLDIGTGSAESLILEIEDEKRIQGMVLGVGKEKFQDNWMPSEGIIEKGGLEIVLMSSIDQALVFSGVKKISKIFVGLGSALIKGETSLTNYIREDPNLKIDSTELKNIFQKIQWKAFNSTRSEIARNYGIPEIDLKLIDSAVQEIKIDGYRVKNPLGLRGKEISVNTFNTFISRSSFNFINNIFLKLNLDSASVVFSPFAIARSLGAFGNLKFDGIFLDIGDKITELLVVKKGRIESARSLLFGGESLTKRISKELSLDIKEAENIKKDYTEDKLSQTVSGKIEKILKEECSIWLSGVMLALKDISLIKLLPSSIYLCGGGSLCPVFKKMLMSQSFISGLSFLDKPKIIYLYPRDIVNIKIKQGNLDTPELFPLFSIANFVLSPKNKKFLNIFNQIIKIIKK